MEKNKQKLLAILEILKETDEQHPITANRITERLHEKGIDAERKSVLRDITALTDYGYDILLHSDNKRGFYLASRDFEDWELKILMDAVQTAQFLTAAETKHLSERICDLSSKAGSEALRRTTQIRWGNKTRHKSVSITIDKVLRAIQSGRRITFQYSFTSADMKKSLKRGGHWYTVSPYSLYWRGDRYYLIGNTDGYENLSCYRPDRMRNVEITEQHAVPAEKLLGKNADLRISDYVRSTVSNFGGEKIVLELLADESALDDIIDCFGENLRVSCQPDGLHVTLRTTESEGLYRWLMQSSGSVTAIAPQSVVNEVKKRIQAAAVKYCII